jgi:hypothetical protein
MGLVCLLHSFPVNGTEGLTRSAIQVCYSKNVGSAAEGIAVCACADGKLTFCEWNGDCGGCADDGGDDDCGAHVELRERWCVEDMKVLRDMILERVRRGD